MDDTVESPCIRECAIDAASGYCRGCWRTLREISYWTTFTPDAQRALLQELAVRRATAPAESLAQPTPDGV